MSYSIACASELLVENLSLFENLDGGNGVLDLACGNGRNGLLLLENNIAVTFADNNKSALSTVGTSISALRSYNLDLANAECWEVDLEQASVKPLENRCFDAVLVFNYLHRPLLPAIKQVISQAGLIFYETFTVHQTEFGRPTNPDYLLKENELLDAFKDWEVIKYFEGIKTNPERAIASLVARKMSQNDAK